MLLGMMSETSIPPLFDTHAHLDEPSLQQDAASIFELAAQNGLVGIVTIGTTLPSSQQSVALARQNPLVHAAVGIHPNYASQAQPGDWEGIVKLAADPAVVAVGETGLDHYWKHCPIEHQLDYFERHLDLSRSTGKPFIVHCRDAEDDVLQVLKTWAATGPLNGVMHSFCGSRAMAEQCVAWGMWLSFSGMLTFKRNQDLRDLLSCVPREKLLVETDSPYLAPQPFRGKRNQPGYVKHTAEAMAAALGIRYDELCELTTRNARQFLKIG